MSEKELKNINQRLDNIEKCCEKIIDHIKFIEKTYETVKAPLSFIKDKFELVTGASKTKPMPSLKDRVPISHSV